MTSDSWCATHVILGHTCCRNELPASRRNGIPASSRAYDGTAQWRAQPASPEGVGPAFSNLKVLSSLPVFFMCPAAPPLCPFALRLSPTCTFSVAQGVRGLHRRGVLLGSVNMVWCGCSHVASCFLSGVTPPPMTTLQDGEDVKPAAEERGDVR